MYRRALLVITAIHRLESVWQTCGWVCDGSVATPVGLRTGRTVPRGCADLLVSLSHHDRTSCRLPAEVARPCRFSWCSYDTSQGDVHPAGNATHATCSRLPALSHSNQCPRQSHICVSITAFRLSRETPTSTRLSLSWSTVHTTALSHRMARKTLKMQKTFLLQLHQLLNCVTRYL